MFDSTFLPGGVGVGEEYRDAEFLSNDVVFREFEAVICSDRFDRIFERAEQSADGVSEVLRVLTVFEEFHKDDICGAFSKGKYSTLITGTDDGIHFEIAEPCAVSFRRSFFDRDSVWDMFAGSGL